MKVLTGAPSLALVHKTTKIDPLWKEILDAHKNNYIMTCAVKPDESDAEHPTKGIAVNLAYTVIGAFEVGGEKLIKVRNPLGTFEWDGAWRDDDPKWTEEMKKEVKLVNKKDGIFFMSLADYFKEYQLTSINKVQKGYTFMNVVHAKDTKAAVSVLTLKKDGKCVISVSQTDARMFNPKDKYKVSSSRVFIAHDTKKKFALVDGLFSKDSDDNNVTVDLKAGTYYIWSKVDFKGKAPVKDYSVSVYAPGKGNKLAIEKKVDILKEVHSNADDKKTLKKVVKV